MLGVIVAKELAEARRDGRVLAILGLMASLIVVGLLAAWASHARQQVEVRRAQTQDRQTFERQGAKPSHSAAHFGRMAYKPPAPLAIFDPGASPYLGQVIWLEAHRQDPAMLRPAEDAPELSRLADLSVAGVLTSLLPLLMFVMGSGAFAAERERGTMRQLMTTGVTAGAIFRGKLLSLAGTGFLISFVVIGISTAIAAWSAAAAPFDTIVRGAGLLAGFTAYAGICAGVALLVSARARTATAALLVLLTVWAVSVVIAPRLAAGMAELLHPTPSGAAFWTRVSQVTRDDRRKRGSEELRRIEASVISRAVGRSLTEQDVASLKVNRAALGQEVSEVLGAQAHAKAYADLYEIHDRQQRVRRWASIVAPAVPLLHWSSAMAGGDLRAHRHFALEAERQRQLIVRKMNEDMMLNGAGQGYDYLASADFWRTIPDFAYEPPPAAFALRAAFVDFLLLLACCAVAIWGAWRSACRQRMIQEQP
jgi:ABC-2 type transport system permease protein